MSDVDRELVYVGDPMCSWCWGIAPELDRLLEANPEVPFRLVLGGLRPGPDAAEMTDRMAQTLAHHWHQVAARSGQPFDHSLLERRDWVYDTEPASRAVVVMRHRNEPLAWPLFKRLQGAFYGEGIPISDRHRLAAVVGEFDDDIDGFMEDFDRSDSIKETWRDFALARNWGITGFPTVFLRDGDRGHLIAQGYAPAYEMEISLARLTSATGEAMCAPGEVC